MKHFEITYYIDHFNFVYECSTIHEATQALFALVCKDPRVFDSSKMDEMIETLVSMKNGTTIKHHGAHYSIRYVDGEV